VRSLPIVLDLSIGAIVVVGAGSPALNKLELLRGRGADIHWYPIVLERQEAAAMFVPPHSGRLEVMAGEPDEAAVTDAVAVIAATGTELDERLALMARKFGTPINVVDRPERSTFFFPALVDRGDVVIAISTGGAAPVLARRLRERIEALIPAGVGQLAQFLKRWRDRFRRELGRERLSREFWEKVIDGPIARLVHDGRLNEADDLIAAMSRFATEKGVSRLGSVTLVGAGPGDPDLLTLKALQALQDADVIFYDELVTPEILGRSRREAGKVFVGKRKGKPGADQDKINQQLITAARAGSRVVRLKGGDPFIFGRGGEEFEALRLAGVPVGIVPGITAALGCAAEAEVPLTYRNEATRLMLVTAHRADEQISVDWAELSDDKTTLVVYMGQTSAAAVRDGLLTAGRNPATPAAVLARGTRKDSRTVVGKLKDLASLAARAGEGPALLVVGAVVARSKAWREARLHVVAGVA